jgi:methionyl-tRNA synthetase
MNNQTLSMPKPTSQTKILIGVAWPYANGPQHVGHLAGAYIPADVFARYSRLAGHDVLMVSGSDTHGTPVTLRAESEKSTPAKVANRFHESFLHTYQRLGLSFDLFTHTETENHHRASQEFFRRHQEKGFLKVQTDQQAYDVIAKRFLPDRYVEGECPHCGNPSARGDQCDRCGKLLDPLDLISPRSALPGSSDIEFRDTEHFYFILPKLKAELLAWLQDKDHWRPHVLNYTRSQVEGDLLEPRPVTRDLEWGVRVPVDGWEKKRLYVWYEAVIGYYSASLEWSSMSGRDWRDWWKRSGSQRSYYFIGKDNIPFHTILWPSMLLAHGDLSLPYDVPANQYLKFSGEKLSKSRGAAVEVDALLDTYQPDAIRYALTALAPENDDVDFTWEAFNARINNELVATWGNLVNRVLGFAHRHFDARVPSPGRSTEVEDRLYQVFNDAFPEIGSHFANARARLALVQLRELTRKVNQYVQESAPWELLREDKAACASVVYHALQAIDWLKVLWAPILPHSSEQLHAMFGYTWPLFGEIHVESTEDKRSAYKVLRYRPGQSRGKWELAKLEVNQKLQSPQTLFRKIE